MSDFGVAYVSVHPDVLAVYDVGKRDEQNYQRRAKRLAKEHLPPDTNWVRDHHPTSNAVCGYALRRARNDHGYLDPRDYDCLPGWRTRKELVVDGKDGMGLYAEPLPVHAKNGRSPEAKAARELLSFVQPPANLYKRFITSFAMPGLILAGTEGGGMAIHYPGIAPAKKVVRKSKDNEAGIKVGDVLVFWDIEPKMINWTAATGDGVQYFRRISLATYYAALGK